MQVVMMSVMKNACIDDALMMGKRRKKIALRMRRLPTEMTIIV